LCCFNDTSVTEIYLFSLPDALTIYLVPNISNWLWPLTTLERLGHQVGAIIRRRPVHVQARFLTTPAGLLTRFLTAQAGLLTRFLSLRAPDRF